MSKKTFLASIVCGLAVMLAQPKPLLAAKPTLAGSWQFTLTPNGPPTPPAIVIPGLATFTTDGSMIETDGSEVAVFGTPGHGIWQLSPCLCSFYLQYNSVTVNANGSLATSSVTVATVTMTTATNPATFAGQYTTTTSGPTGMPPKITTGTVNGQLIPHPFLP